MHNDMIEILTVKLMTLGSITVKTLMPTSVPVIAMSEGMITEATGVPLTILCAVGGACWYLQGRFTKIEDRLDRLNDNIQSRPCQAQPCPITKGGNEKDKNT